MFLVNAGIAFFHTGVEQHWWAGLETCSGGGSEPQTLEELRQQLFTAPAARCDTPAFVFMGLSMAGWNVLYCLGLSAFFMRLAFRRAASGDHAHSSGSLG